MDDSQKGIIGGAGCATSGLLAGLGGVLFVVAASLVSFAVSCHGAGAEWGATDHSIGLGLLLGAALDIAIALVGILGVIFAVGGVVALAVAVTVGVVGASVLERIGINRRRAPTDDTTERR